MKKIFISRTLLLIMISFMSVIPVKAENNLDEAGQKLIDVILSYQQPSGITPFSIEDNVETGSDYTWGLWMMAIVAAERNGYIDRATAVERLSKMLNAIDQLKKYKGWLYWGYNLETLEPDSERIGFQGWYLYSLIVIKNVYPELAPLCEKFISAVDYSVVYDQQERFLADYNVAEEKRLWRIPLGPLSDGSDMGHPASERRVAYQVYTYITGDKGPWLLPTDPNFQALEGYTFLSVWAHYNFDIAHLHYVLPELGYFERSWDYFLKASESFMKKEGLKFFPARSGPLEEGLWTPNSPNTEHRETMPWVTWYLDKNAPVMDYCFKPGHGLFRYYDQWNYYWSFGKEPQFIASLGNREGAADIADSSLSVRFFINTSPRFTRPPQLQKLSIIASYPDPKNPPKGNLEIFLNRNKIGEITPQELTNEPKRITKSFNVDLKSVNTITLKDSDTSMSAMNRFDLYKYENQISTCMYSHKIPEISLTESVHGYHFSYFAEEVNVPNFPGPALEVICEGQDIGPTVEDTCTAFLIRIGVVHDYYVWKDLLNDSKFMNSLVAWVGNYSTHVSMAPTVHNVSSSPVKVEYDRPESWSNSKQIQVVDEKESKDISDQLVITDKQISWEAQPYHTYIIAYKGDN